VILRRRSRIAVPLVALALLAGACQSRSPSQAASRATAVPVGTEQAAIAEAQTASPSGTADTLAQAYKILLARLVLPVQPDALLNGAWSGAVAEARRQEAISLPPASALGSDATADLTGFQTAYAALLSSGKGRLDEGALERAALISMAESVNDCHTAYLTRDQWQSIDADLQGQESIDSLPLAFQLQAPYLIESVVAGSNADQLGVGAGDRIVSFDGADLDRIPLSQRKFLSVGAAGSSARLDLLAPDGSRRSVSVRREAVDRPVLTTRLIGSVAYLHLRTFTFNLSSMLDPTFTSLIGQGARGFVLDLRGNLGGELNSDAHLLSRFIPSGLVATSIERDGRTEDINADGGVLPGPPPLAVLVDGGSLSASELFAEAIEQFQAGEVVGTRTPGCLLGSTFRSLSDGSSIQVTALGVRVGPNQTVVNNVGVAPDVTVPISAADLAAGSDPQLDRAVADVRARIGP
jgi:carboxyl-terminal processing protease